MTSDVAIIGIPMVVPLLYLKNDGTVTQRFSSKGRRGTLLQI